MDKRFESISTLVGLGLAPMNLLKTMFNEEIAMLSGVIVIKEEELVC